MDVSRVESVSYRAPAGRSRMRYAFAVSSAVVMLLMAFQTVVGHASASDSEFISDITDSDELISVIEDASDPEQEWVPNVAEPVTWTVPGGSVESFGEASSVIASTIANPIAPSKVLVSEDHASYETVHGTYSIAFATPFSISLSSADGTPLVDESYFTLRSGADVMVPCNGAIVELHSHCFTVSYDVALPGADELAVVGSMELKVGYDSSQVPKMTCTVLEVDDSLASWQVVWQIAPSDDYEVYDAGQDGPGTKIGRAQGAMYPVPGLAVDIVSAGASGSPTFRVDWKDAGEGYLTFCNCQLLSGEDASVVRVLFSEGRTEIDPTIVATVSTNEVPTGMSCQRKTFWSGGYYWVFYYRGDIICYKNSIDGITWSSETTLPGGTDIVAGSSFDVAERQGEVGIAWIDEAGLNDILYFMKGSVVGNKITWQTKATVYAYVTLAFTVVTAVTSDGWFWITGEMRNGPYGTLFYVYRTLDGSSFESVLGDYVVRGVGDNYFMLLPFGNGNIALLETWYVDGTVSDSYVRLRYWSNVENSVSWPGWSDASIMEIDSSYGLTRWAKNEAFSAVAGNDGDIHLVYKDIYSDLRYARYEGGSYWTEKALLDPTYYPRYPSISLDANGIIHVFYGLSSSSSIKHMERPARSDAAWSTSRTEFVSVSGLTPLGITSWVSPLGHHCVVWTENTSPKTISFANTPLPFGTSGAAATPWEREGLSPYGTYFSSLGDQVSAGTGLLNVRQTDVSVPGRGGVDLDVSRLYMQPKYFSKADGSPYMSTPFPGCPMGLGWGLDLPWTDGKYVVLQGGQRYVIQWGNNGDPDEFENHDGTHFVLREYSFWTPKGTVRGYELITGGMRYDFDYYDYKLWQISSLQGYDLDDPMPFLSCVNTLFIDWDYTNNRIEGVSDELGREVLFTYNANGLLSTITRPDMDTISFTYSTVSTPIGTKYVLTKATDARNRETTYTYYSGSSYDYCVLLATMTYPTSGKVTYTYAKNDNAGTDVRSWLVTSQAVRDASNNALFRQTNYDYKVSTDQVCFAKVTQLDGNSNVQGWTECVFSSGLRYSSETTRDSQGMQMSKTVTWYDSCGQPARVDTYEGSSQTVSYTEYMGYDDWGNAIYSRNALGGESYMSFANTHTENSFQGGDRLERTSSGMIFNDAFDDWECSDWVPSLAPGNTVTIDGTQSDSSSAPALKVARTETGNAFVSHGVPAQSQDFIWQTKYMSTTTLRSYVLGLSDGATQIRLYFWTEGSSFVWYDGSTNPIDGVIFRANVWYDLGFHVHPGTNKYDVYIDGTLMYTGANMYGSSGYIDTIRYQACYSTSSDTAILADNIRVYRSLSITVSGASGYVLELFDSKGDLLDRTKTGTLTVPAMPLSFPPGYIKASKIGMHSFQTPMMDIWGGDAYSLVSGTSISYLPKTTVGFDRAISVTADDSWPSGSTYISWNDAPNPWVVDSDNSVRGTSYHESREGDSYHWHGWHGANGFYVYTSYALVQYVWLTDGKIPKEIMLQYQLGGVWRRAYWGGNSTDASIVETPGYAPVTSVRMGDVPQTTGKWLQLVVKVSDLGLTSSAYLTGAIYGVYDMTARWDVTASAYSYIRVSGLSAGITARFESDDGEYYAYGTATSTYVNLDLCANGASAFPLSGTIEISNAGTLLYESPWIGEVYNYDVYTYYAPEFYANDVQDDIRHSLVGSLTYQDAAKTVRQVSYASLDAFGNTVESKTRLTDSVWPTSSFVYDTYGNQVLATDPTGRQTFADYTATTWYAYPSASGPKDGSTKVFTNYTWDYDTGEMLSETDPLLRTTSYQYDEVGRMTRVTYADGEYESYLYDDTANKVTRYDELNHKWVSYYDKIGRMYREERCGLLSSGYYSYVLYAYNWDDSVYSQRNERGYYTYYAYDFLGRLTRVTNPDTPDSSFRTVAYDDVAGTQTYTDELGHKTVKVFDDLGRHVATREYYSSSSYYTTSMTYDAAGNLLTVTDARMKITTMTYDAVNRLVRTTYPDTKYEEAVYDAAGRVMSKVDRSGRTTTTTYDYAGRPTLVSYYGGSMSRTYDLAGQVITETNLAGTITYGYSLRGDVTSTTQTVSGSSFSMSFSYDDERRLTRIVYPGGAPTIDYAYDNYDRVQYVYNGPTVMYTMTYNADDTVATETTHTDQKTTFSYNNRGWIDSVVMKMGTKTKLSLSYSYDYVGNVLEIGSESYTYDYLNRLSTATGPWGYQTFTYDAVGNRIGFYDAGDYTSYTYNDYNQLTSDSKGYYYSYDNNGNLIGKWKASTVDIMYVFDSLDRLQTYSEQTYNPKTHKWKQIALEYYTYDSHGARVKTTDDMTGTTTYSIYAGHDLYSQKVGTTYESYVYVNGRMKATKLGGDIYYYIADALGSTRQIWKHTQTTKAYLTVESYEPFGTPYNMKGDEEMLFAGEMQDSNGNYYIFARYMDPSLGRWLSLDPELGSLSIPQTLNRYVYCANNPLRFIDPTGEGFWSTVTKAIKDNWKTIVVVAVVVTVIVATGGIGLPAAIALSAVATSAVEGLDTAMKGGDLRDIGWSMAKGFAEGAITGIVGAGIGAGLAKVGAMAAKGILTGALKPALNEVGKKAGAKVTGGVASLLSKASPSVSKQIGKVSSSLLSKADPVFKKLDYIRYCGLSAYYDDAVANTRLFTTGYAVAEELGGSIVTTALEKRIAPNMYSS